MPDEPTTGTDVAAAIIGHADGRITPAQRDALLEGLDPSTMLDAGGKVDAAKVDALIDTIAGPGGPSSGVGSTVQAGRRAYEERRRPDSRRDERAFAPDFTETLDDHGWRRSPAPPARHPAVPGGPPASDSPPPATTRSAHPTVAAGRDLYRRRHAAPEGGRSV